MNNTNTQDPDNRAIQVSVAALMLPHEVSSYTVTRWIVVGLKTRSGVRVKLAGQKIGARWFTTMKAIREFQQQINDTAS